MIHKNINDIAYGPRPELSAIDHLMSNLSTKGVGGNEKKKKKDIYKTIKNVISGEALPFTILQYACNETGLNASINESFSKLLRNRWQ